MRATGIWSLLLILLTLESCLYVVSSQEEVVVQEGAAVVVGQEGVDVTGAQGTGAAEAVQEETQNSPEESGSASEEEEEEESEYLYEEDADPVIEYKSDAEDKMHPDFLFSTDNGPRMVEFYAWWYV